MEVVIERFGPFEFSPYSRFQSSQIFSAASVSSHAESHPVRWIDHINRIAKSGLPQAAVLAISIALIASSVLFRRQRSVTSTSKASWVKWHYEFPSQFLRIVATAFLVDAYARQQSHLFNVVVLGYIFAIGLSRLVNNLQWRHTALHHVNFLLVAQFFILIVAQYLPCIQVGSSCSRESGVNAAIICIGAAILLASITPREWMPPQLKHDVQGLELPTEPAPEESCSWLNYYCTYEWLTPTIWKGTKGILDIKSMPVLAWYDEPLYLLQKVQAARAIAKSTMWTTFRFQRSELTLMAVWSALSFTVENLAPYGMFMLLDYIANPTDAVYKPWLWISFLFIGPLTRSILFQQYVFTSTRLVVRIKSAMTQELYFKALASMELDEDPFQSPEDAAKAAANPQLAQKTTSAGRLANLMAADVDAIFRGRDIVMIGVGVPIGTIVSLIGLYKILGWTSLIGMFVLVAASPISVFLSKLMYKTQRRVRKSQDTRISLVSEYLSSIRAIKYFAWEGPITEKIVGARATEQKGLWGMAILQTTINQVTQAFPLLALVIMFALYVGLGGNKLDASTAFTAVTLVKNIRRNIMMASALSRSFAGAIVAFGRLDKYFSSTVPVTEFPVGPLKITNATFRKNKKAAFILENINLDFVEGGLNVITGQSGSGKSTLLLSILGETYLEAGSVTAPADIAFASQTSWLQNDTIQNNILFGSPMDRARYNRIVRACCLDLDLKELPDRDMTLVGENGTSLSGGQKARVALARALYCKAPLLLLDDIFSALDAKTSAGVWKRCFCTDLLKGRTTLLVTQVPWISLQADYAIELERGQIRKQEPNIGVVRKPITIADVLGGDGDDEDDNDDYIESETPAEPELDTVDKDPLNNPTKIAQQVSQNDIVDQEMKATGKVGRLTFIQYMNYFGHPAFGISCIVGLLLSNLFFFGSSLWLSIWIEAYDKYDYVNVTFYLSIYGVLAFLEFFSYGIIVIVFEWGAWRAGRALHNDFIRSVMASPLSWFNTIPIGRIINRFSGDMASIDGQLSGMVRGSLDAVMMFFFRIVSISSIMPVFMIPSFFTCLFGIVIGEMYTRTAVIIKRLTSSSQSPVFSQFADTLAGLPVIRARAGKSQAFREELADKLRIWSASSESNYNCNRWVAVRIDFVTSLISLCAGIIAISQVGVVSAGLVGFSLSNANGLNQTILYLVRAMNDLEVEIQSFHRVKEYAKLTPEDENDKPYPEEGEYADNEAHVIPHNWPSTGDIEFRNVTIRYDPDGPDILTDVNLKFKAGERVAVVGRTGSGKSTLVLSLLRFTHIVSGQIFYNGIDITKVPRRRLRESLTIIPQEAVLFNGTVQSNLDPTDSVPDNILEEALENCRGIASFSGNDSSNSDNEADGIRTGIHLSTDVEAKGENFSHGQRQVLSLCRALIRKSKLMLLDEATASMDYETDRGIQQVLRKELEDKGGDSTLVTIAHRLRTIIDYDTVVVMSSGKVVECGSPRDLYYANGLFYDMVYHSGELEELQEILDSDKEQTVATTSSGSSSTNVE